MTYRSRHQAIFFTTLGLELERKFHVFEIYLASNNSRKLLIRKVGMSTIINRVPVIIDFYSMHKLYKGNKIDTDFRIVLDKIELFEIFILSNVGPSLYTYAIR